MKLSDFIKQAQDKIEEMAIGDSDQTATQAAATINKYAPMVIGGQSKDVGAMYGPLEGALKALGKTAAPEKYTREIKLAQTALNKIKIYNSKTNVHDTPSMAACGDLEKKKMKKM
jgi:hypothetical protein